MKKTGIQNAFDVSKERALEEKHKVNLQCKHLHDYWEKEQYEFLKSQDEAKAKMSDLKTTSIRKSRTMVERQRKLGKRIKIMKGVTKEKISHLIGRTEDGQQIQLYEQSKMEAACIRSNKKRFTQANDTFAASEQVLLMFGTLAEKPPADEVLEGTFDTS